MTQSKPATYDEKKVNGLFMFYMNSGMDKFEKKALSDARSKMKNHLKVNQELLAMSNEVLEAARAIEEKTNNRCNDWRDLAGLLRKVAHKIYREYGDKRKSNKFLHLVS